MTRLFNRRNALFVVLALLLTAYYVYVGGGNFPLDDSWIHQVYGRNLAQTGQWAFVPGEPSGASTSPLYTVLLAFGYFIGAPFRWWTHLLGALALGVTGMFGAKIAERVLPEVRFAGVITGASLVLSWHLIWAAASGMETMLFSMWVMVVIAASWWEMQTEHRSVRGSLLRGATFGAVSALATTTRPEGALLAFICGVLVLIARPQGSRAFVVWAVGTALGFAIFIAPYLLLNYSITGGPLPTTSAAKQAQNAPQLALPYYARYINMTYPLIAGAQLLLIPGLVAYVVLVVRRLREGRTALLFLALPLWGVALIGLYAARLPAPYQHGRYVIPALPALIAAGVIGTIWLVHLGSSSRKTGKVRVGWVLSRTLLVAVPLAFVVFAFVIAPPVYKTDVSIIDEEMVSMAFWIRENIPPEDLLAVHDIGAVGYFAPRPILDIAGLVNPEVIPIYHNEEALWALLQERNAVYLMAFPDQVPGEDTTDERICEIHNSNGPTSQSINGPSMTIYALTWNGVCP